MKIKHKCQRCGESHILIFCLPMGKLGQIKVCKVCWTGLAYGLKVDFELFSTNEQAFMDQLGYTKKIVNFFKK